MVVVCCRMAYEVVVAFLTMMLDMVVILTVLWGMVEGVVTERKGLEGLL